MKLHQIINPALESVSVDLIRKFFRKARDDEKAYLEGLKGVEEAVKSISHTKNFFRSYLILPILCFRFCYLVVYICNFGFQAYFSVL